MWTNIQRNPLTMHLDDKIWIWVIKIQITYLDALKKVKDLDLTNPTKILNI